MTTSIQRDALLSQFSVLAYRDRAFLSNTANLPSGWELKAADDQSPPFAAFAFKNNVTGEVVIAYRGTDGLKDGSADAAILAGRWNPQFQKGMDFVAAVRSNVDVFPDSSDVSKLLVTGHSLGGAIAQIVAQAYGLNGSAIDPGAAGRIVQTTEFRAAALAAGLPPGGLGAAAGFTNYLVAGSVVSGGTGEHVGQSSYLPSLTFSGETALTAFLIGLVNPVAGFAYAVGTDQFANKHASAQVSQALALLAGAQDSDAPTPGAVTLRPRIVGSSVDPATGENRPVYSQTEFDVRDAATGALQSTVKFAGAGAERLMEVFDAGGSLQSTTTLAATGAVTVRPISGGAIVVAYLPEVIANQDGTVTMTTKDAQGNVLSSSITQTFDDGSSLTTTQHPGNITRTVTRDTDGNIARIVEAESIGTLRVETIIGANGAAIETRRQQVFDDGSTLESTSTPDGSETRVTRDAGGTEVSRVVVPSYAQTFVSTIADTTSLINAIKSGEDLPQVASGLKLLNTLDRTESIPGLGTTDTIGQGVLSVYNLHNAFGGGADALSKVSATLNTVNYVNLTFAQAGLPALNTSLNTLLNGSGVLNTSTVGALPALGLITSIETGDPIGAAMSLGTMLEGSAFLLQNPIGWGLLAASLIKALEEPPEAWGIGTFTFSAGGTELVLDAQGESFGIDRVRQLMQGNGASPSHPDGSANPGYFGGVQGYLQQMIAASTQAWPDVPLGIIPQRLPTLTWREARQPDPGYAVRDIDPLSGAERFPGLRYNDDWAPYNADATDPDQRRNIFERLAISALERDAVAPLWEVRTAKLQQDAGDPLAGLTEEERAARRGLLAALDPLTNQRTAGEFRPVALDLDGDGRIATVMNADTDRNFNWDGSGFDKQVGWVDHAEGLLWLDRNPNGLVDSGEELFSNSTLADAAKGARSLISVDANGDGRIDAADPVFGELEVWQDADGDAQVDAGEAMSLSELGIGELDYSNARFTRNGQLRSMQTVVLETSSDGQRASEMPEGIRIEFSDGRATLYVTRVSDLGAGNDGIDAVEDGGIDRDTNGQPTGQASSRRDPISIASALLLANDQISGSSAGLVVTAVGNASVGSVTLNPQTGIVEFRAPHHFSGAATFDYTVAAPGGQSKSATVTINLAPANDRPDVQCVLPERAIYGWGVLVRRETVSVGGDGGSEERITITPGMGEPFYAPYRTVQGQRYETVVIGQNEGGVVTEDRAVGTAQDTGIPQSYFDAEYARSSTVDDAGQTVWPAYLTVMWNGQKFRVAAAAATYLHDTPVAFEPGNDGQVVATDVDGGAQFRYEIYAQPLYGRLGGESAVDDIDPNTGGFTYEGRRYVAYDEGGNFLGRNVYSDKHARGEWDGDPAKVANWDSFTVKAVDLSDPTGNTFTLKEVKVAHFGPLPNPDVQSGAKKPIAIDLDGDGFHFTDVDDSNVFYNVNADGWRRRIAWNNPDDGFIAFDKNGDARITDFDELSFVPYDASGRTDLEALRRAFDSNRDGVFSAADERWNSFGVWRDADADGVSDDGEFASLAQMGITSISLAGDGQFQVIDGQTVHGTAVAARSNGGTYALADVSLRYKNETAVIGSDGSTTIAPVPTIQPGTEFNGTAGPDLVLGTSGSDMFRTGDGDDVVNDDLGNDAVQAGAGDDLIYTGSDNDVVDAGAGNDTVFAGVGNDLVFGDDADDMLMLEGGNDVAFGGAGHDFIAGGEGNDAISGDGGDDKLFGEGGWDALFGKRGDDELWGLDGNDLLYGDEGVDLLIGGAGDDQMEGGLGDDTYEMDSAGDRAIERAGEGTDTVRSSIAFALLSTLENLTLTGPGDIHAVGNASANVLVGNAGRNRIEGLAGDDTLDGGVSADVLVGGSGNDTYVVDDAGDLVVEADGEGTDTVRSRVSATLVDHVENLTLIGIAAIDGAGNGADNVLAGNAAANTLDGQGGADELRGGRGNDRYVVDAAGDHVFEENGEGHDTVRVSGVASYTLGDNLEALELGSLAFDGSGNGLDNLLTGNADANRLDGGAGADVMAGGAGDDTYVVDAADDQTLESAGAGIDTVLSGVSWTLASDTEVLVLGGAADIDGTGNALDNTLNGNAGANRLDGGAGADVMSGGQGDDGYQVESAGDAVHEDALAGFDRVDSSIDYVLPEHVEQLTLMGAARNGIGNALDNLLFGNDSDNLLDGAAGSDQMAGGLGDDRYLADAAGDSVLESESLDAGNDTVYANVGHALSGNVENLILTGSAAIDAAGNDLANVIVGNAAANRLSAGDADDVLAGWLGDDLLEGDGGDDLYLYHQGEGRDLIIDTSGTDTLRFGAGMTLDSVAGRLIQVDGQNRLFISILGADGQETDRGVEIALNGDGTVPIERFEFAGGQVAAAGQIAVVARSVNGTGGADVITGDRNDDSVFAGSGNDIVYGRTGNDILYGGAHNDKLFGEGGHDRLYGETESDELWGGAGDDLLDGGAGADTLVGGTGNDSLLGAADADRLDGGDGNDLLDGSSGEDQLFGGGGADTLRGGTDLDLLAAGDGDDSIESGSGAAVVVAGQGHDRVLTDTNADFVDGAGGDDSITTLAGNDFIAAGRGNDRIDAGADRDILAFNRGDGIDTVVTSSWQRDTLSLGAGIRYADIALRKAGNDLVVELQQGDSVTLEGWYLDSSRRNITTLQVVTGAPGGDYVAGSSDRMRNRKAVSYDFERLVNRFDAARAANPALTTWSTAPELNAVYLSGSDTQAIGGDMAYRYATTGSYGDLDWRAIQSRLARMGAGTLQPLGTSSAVNPWTALQAGVSLIADQTIGLPSPITPMAPPSADELVHAAFNASANRRPHWIDQLV